MESFGRLGKEGSELIDQLAASIVGGTDGGSLSRKGVCNEHLVQILAVTTQLAISRRMHRYKPALLPGPQREKGGGWRVVSHGMGVACRRGVGRPANRYSNV